MQQPSNPENTTVSESQALPRRAPQVQLRDRKLDYYSFSDRHLGPDQSEIEQMLKVCGFDSMDQFIKATIPDSIRIPEGEVSAAPILEMTERQAQAKLRELLSQNVVKKPLLGQGYYRSHLPDVIRRCILENAAWYTPYTPYQPEISQGRLESLLNFQTMVADLCGCEIANASLLDDGTAMAEAVMFALRIKEDKTQSNLPAVWMAKDLFEHVKDVTMTRSLALGLEVEQGHQQDFGQVTLADGIYSVCCFAYQDARGKIDDDLPKKIALAKKLGAITVVYTDLLALTLWEGPGHFGADVVVGSSQRFGIPLGFGGPYAGFFATKKEFIRKVPGRIIGVSKDQQGRPSYRLTLQTREQHIRRDRATSNICTAQALLANISAMYAIYHGPQGLKSIANRVHFYASVVANYAVLSGHVLLTEKFFDTVCIKLKGATSSVIISKAHELGFQLRKISDQEVGISLDECVEDEDLRLLLGCFGSVDARLVERSWDLAVKQSEQANSHGSLKRLTPYMTHPVFHKYRSETELMRYIRALEEKDLSLVHSMIPLGSCTMKLNSAAELTPLTWESCGSIHPFAPSTDVKGYHALITDLAKDLCDITGFDAFSFQPNSGAQGEYAGLLAIKYYLESLGQAHRDICLIPESAHGTNPASAVMAGMTVVVIRCDAQGNIDLFDLQKQGEKYKDRLAALMLTYPSTHGVFEELVVDVCEKIHAWGGQVYMDGANMNAQVGLCKPGKFGADVAHLNLHKTFCIPHGGGGPGVGPIGVKAHLAAFLPGENLQNAGKGAVSSAPFGSASLLVIPWMYIKMMGSHNLRRASEIAILNANYVAKKLAPFYPILYTGSNGTVAHECILDLRKFQKSLKITVEDVAKRLMDYGFHAPTMAWPVPGTLMIEPTESEGLLELDRFCEAMISIRQEIDAIEAGTYSEEDNPLKYAPHTVSVVTASDWPHLYSREVAAFPKYWLRERKFWPSVSRIDNAYGDRQIFCSCLPLDDYR